MGIIERWATRAAGEPLDRLSVIGRSRVGLLEGWVSVVVNLVLALLKGALGVMSGSVALLADAFHTLADCLTSGAIIIGFWMSSKPADEEHPFGHGRIESVVSVIVAVLLGVTAVELGRASVGRIVTPQPTHSNWWIALAVALTAVAKAWISWFSYKLGGLIDSSALKVDAMHHFTDVLATLLVLVALGGQAWGIPWLDGVIGVVVSLFIAWAAVEAMRSATGPLIGEFAPDEVYQQIRRIAMSCPGVEDVHDIVVHRYGQTNVISLHVEVLDRLSSSEVHEIATSVEEAVLKVLGGYVTVHADPIDDGHPLFARARQLVGDVLSSCEGCGRAHDLRVEGRERVRVDMDVTIQPGVTEKQKTQCRGRLEQRLDELSPGNVSVRVRFLPPYSRDG